MFLENYRDFCCLNFKKVLSLLYTPSRTAYGLIWLRKVSALVSANDCSRLPDRTVKRTSGDKRSNERLALVDGDHSATIDLGKARFRTSLATTPWREVGLQEICRIRGSGHHGVRCASGNAIPVTSHGTSTMKPTDYDMVKLALNSVDLVILRSRVQQAMKRRPDADWQRLDLLTRARDLLAEFYLVQGNGHGRELGTSRTRTGVRRSLCAPMALALITSPALRLAGGL